MNTTLTIMRKQNYHQAQQRGFDMFNMDLRLQKIEKHTEAFNL